MASLSSGLRNPVGLVLLAASGTMAIAVSILPPLASFASSAMPLVAVGAAAYVLVVLVFLVTEPGDSAVRHPATIRLLDIRRQMAARLAELKAAGAGRESALVPVVADAIRHMDGELIPTFRKLVSRSGSLQSHLSLYEAGKLARPDERTHRKLILIHERQEEAISGCVQQAANVYATLIAVIMSADEAGMLEEARLWARDIDDIYDGLSEVLSGVDPLEQAMATLRLDASAAGWVEPLIEQAVARVEPTTAAPAAEPHRGRAEAFPDGLTHREAEVLALLADGLRSSDIAERLVVTLATVSRHIANIYGKTGCRGRADATRYALRHGITSSRLFPPDGRGSPPSR